MGVHHRQVPLVPAQTSAVLVRPLQVQVWYVVLVVGLPTLIWKCLVYNNHHHWVGWTWMKPAVVGNRITQPHYHCHRANPNRTGTGTGTGTRANHERDSDTTWADPLMMNTIRNWRRRCSSLSSTAAAAYESIMSSSSSSSSHRRCGMEYSAAILSPPPPPPLLPWGDLNVVALTDVHSWVGGHAYKEPYMNVDYGAVLSFLQRLREDHIQSQQSDFNNPNQSQSLWFVTNGDWIDGTALALNGDASFLIPLLEKMPWDALNIGNHELYHNSVIDYMDRPGGYVDWWGQKLLSSNILRRVETTTTTTNSSATITNTSTTTNTNTMSTNINTTELDLQPIGNRYRILHDRVTNHKVLAFGFLYDMKDHADHVVVTSVHSTIQEAWFENALLVDESYDAILVLAHMGAKDTLIDTILQKIRAFVGDSMPVQFIAGHTHKRQVNFPDPACSVVEAGRYLDTIGFVSFPTQSRLLSSITTNTNTTSNTTDNILTNVSESVDGSRTAGLFQYRFLDANVELLAQVLDLNSVDELMTDEGKELSEFINRTQEDLGLHKIVGCLEGNYYLENRSLFDADSLWKFFSDYIVPTQFEPNAMLVLGQGSWRYDLLGGNGDLRLDDVVAVSPFNESLVAWENISGLVMDELNRTLNDHPSWMMPLLPEYIFSPAAGQQIQHPIIVFDPESNYTLVTDLFSERDIQDKLVQLIPNLSRAKELVNKTTAGIWINYFLERQEECTALTTAVNDSIDVIHSGGRGNMSAGVGAAYPISDANLNILVGILSVVAIVVVTCVSVLHVRQRSAIWNRRVERIEFATMSAIQERRIQLGDADSDDENELL